MLVEKIKALRSINGLVFDDMPFSPIEVELQRIEGKLARLKSGLAYCDYSTGSLNRFLERLPSDRGPHPIIRTLGEAPQQTNAMILRVYEERFIDLHLSHLVDAASLYTGAPNEQIKTAIEMQPRIKAKWMNWMENHLNKKYLVDGEFSDQRELSVGNELLKYLLNALKLEFNSGYPVFMNLEELAQEIVTQDREVLIDHLSRSNAPLLLTSIESGDGKIIIGDNIELDYCASLTRDLLDRADQLEFESKTEAEAKIETESKRLTPQQAMDSLNLASKIRDLSSNIEVRYFAQSDMRFVYDASKVSVSAVERSFLVTPGTGEIVEFANDDELKKSEVNNKKISTDLRACISEFTSRETDEKLTEVAVHLQSGAVQKKRACLNFQSYLVFAREMIKQYPNLRVLGDVNFDIANLAVLMQLTQELAKINKDIETAGLPTISMAIPKDLAIKEREVSAFNAQIAKVNGGPPTVSDSMLILFSGNLRSESSYILTAELDDEARTVSDQYFS